MEYIHRALEDKLNIATPKAIVVFGPRRAGKTTLLRHMVKDSTVRWYNADRPADVRALDFQSEGDLQSALRQAETLVIDEAQRVPNIGLILKMLVDVNETLDTPTRIYVSGSSSFELAKGIRESALGRLITHQLWPFSLSEIADSRGWGYVQEHIDDLLVHGTYPSAFENPDANDTLRDFCEGLLYKDIFALSNIRRSNRFEHLVKVLAYSIGSEVNYDSLARETGLNKSTVADYITLLEQSYIVKTCPSFAKNLPNELKKGKKVYFCDNGLRNALIDDFSPISERADKGALWENLFFMERVKQNSLRGDGRRIYFWRTTGSTPHELDFIEIGNRLMKAFECKTSEKGKANPGKDFSAAYPDCPIEVATPSKVEIVQS